MRLYVVFGAVVLAALIPSLGSAQPHDSDATFFDAFMGECALELSEVTCQCIVEELRTGFTLDEVSQAGFDNAVVATAAMTCLEQAENSGSLAPGVASDSADLGGVSLAVQAIIMSGDVDLLTLMAPVDGALSFAQSVGDIENPEARIPFGEPIPAAIAFALGPLTQELGRDTEPWETHFDSMRAVYTTSENVVFTFQFVASPYGSRLQSIAIVGD